VGLSDLGGALTWGEAKILLDDAAADPGTALGAELAGWAYPASMRDLLSLVAQIGDHRVARRLMPWVLENPRREAGAKATPDEIATAEAELENEFVFT
jgi:hypothetical protein